MKTKKRPVFLAVAKYRYPITAIVSILHRGSGVILFFAIPALLWALQISLVSEEGFLSLQKAFYHPVVIAGFWLIFAALLFHLAAGVRHLLMDIGFGESKQAGRKSAFAAILVAIGLLVAAGIYIWW